MTTLRRTRGICETEKASRAVHTDRRGAGRARLAEPRRKSRPCPPLRPARARHRRRARSGSSPPCPGGTGADVHQARPTPFHQVRYHPQGVHRGTREAPGISAPDAHRCCPPSHRGGIRGACPRPFRPFRFSATRVGLARGDTLRYPARWTIGRREGSAPGDPRCHRQRLGDRRRTRSLP